MLIINIKALPLMMPNVMAQASFIAKSEKYIEDLSAMLRARPTLPMGMAPSDLDTAMFMPHKHCAFKDCNWSGANDEELTDHLFDAHHGIFQNDIVVDFDGRSHTACKCERWRLLTHFHV